MATTHNETCHPNGANTAPLFKDATHVRCDVCGILLSCDRCNHRDRIYDNPNKPSADLCGTCRIALESSR